MAAVVGVFVQKVPFSNAGPGAFIGEVWRFPASTAGDTMTLTTKYIAKIVAVIGDVSATVLLGANVASLTTLDTIAASNFMDIIVYGYSAP